MRTKKILNAAMKNRKEKFPSFPNNPPGRTFKRRCLFRLRKVADLQISSVLIFLKPWFLGLSGSVLEIGCGHQPYRHFIPASCRYTGLDWEDSREKFQYSSPETVYYKGGDFPFSDGSFDSLFHTEVLEHIYDTGRFLRECRRVLKPGGKMFFTVPFQARYHYIPYDYWRFTEASLERMLTDAGFTEINIKPRGNDITVAVYKNISVIYRWLQGNFVGKVIGCVFLPVGIILLLLGHFTIRFSLGSQDDCLGYVVYSKS